MPAGKPPRPHVRCRSLFLGDTKLYVRGVTYGTFEDEGYPSPAAVARDFAMMAANEINAVRTYTVPPRWLLDLAQEHGLLVMVGLPWEQHVAFLSDRRRAGSIVERVREGVRSCAGHPAVLCYVVGNEIPTSIVRWYGRRRIERFIRRLYRAAKDEDPDGLVTYVNYPSTEYLDLEFLDLCCFNVFLETPSRYEAYLARLQNIAGDRPLLLTELGLDSRRNGLDAQAHTIDWKVRGAFASGASGAFVFAWTDEWHRGGYAVEDWDFGLVDRAREPKPALAAARRAFADLPLPADSRWPAISVLICAYNAEDTIRECLEGVQALDYPDFETIVVDDGSTDATAAIASEFDLRLISTENQGLATARNVGLGVATGEIVAYLDSDAYPDPHWLKHLAAALSHSEHAGVGGPNVAPADDGLVARCVSKAPGGPIHVLLSDREAEHIPGCNMAFRKSRLEAVGGFAPEFRTAGDDVDICWRIQEQGWTLGFSPGAVVWHHPRRSVRGYLKQQFDYGKAEAGLERRWPERYNDGGHLTWTGRVYGNGRGFGRRWRVYYGAWGGALFQSRRERPAHALTSMPALPEWGLIIAALAALSSVAVLWTPMLAALGLLGIAITASVVDAGIHAKRATEAETARRRLWPWALSTSLHLLQPFARLGGRVRHGLAPWRRNGRRGFELPLPQARVVWSETWRAADDWLKRLDAAVRLRGAPIRRGGPYDRWDLEVRGCVFGAMRVRMAVEEHGSGRQLLRFRLAPRAGLITLLAGLGLLALSAAAGLDGAWDASILLGAASLVVFGLVARGAGGAAATLAEALERLGEAVTDSAEEDVKAAGFTDEPEQFGFPRVRRLPPLEHATLPPRIEAQLARAERGDDEFDDMRV